MTRNTTLESSTRRTLIGLVAMAVSVLTPAAFADADEVTLCHNTGRADQPWEVITVSRSSWEHDRRVSGHAFHGDREVAEGTTADQCEESCTGEGCHGYGSGGA